MASSFGCVRAEVAPPCRGGAARAAYDSPFEDPQTDQRFSRAYRLTSRRQFVRVYERGRRARREAFTIFGLPNELSASRMGLTVTRRSGSAVVRNRVKRVLRDIFRRHRDTWPLTMDIVVNGTSAILRMAPRRVEREFLDAVTELARKVRS
jgi:ribonuclease P protein component